MRVWPQSNMAGGGMRYLWVHCTIAGPRRCAAPVHVVLRIGQHVVRLVGVADVHVRVVVLMHMVRAFWRWRLNSLSLNFLPHSLQCLVHLVLLVPYRCPACWQSSPAKRIQRGTLLNRSLAKTLRHVGIASLSVVASRIQNCQ